MSSRKAAMNSKKIEDLLQQCLEIIHAKNGAAQPSDELSQLRRGATVEEFEAWSRLTLSHMFRETG